MKDFAPRAQTLQGTAAVVNAVAKDANGIGYGGAAYAKALKQFLDWATGPQGQEIVTKTGYFPVK